MINRLVALIGMMKSKSAPIDSTTVSSDEESMKDYKVTITVRNNYLLTAMEENGIKNAAELARLSNVAPYQVGEYLNLKVTPYSERTGKLRTSAKRIADCLKRLPEDLFPPQHLNQPLAKNKAEFELDMEQVGTLVEATTPQALLEHREGIEAVHKCMNSLSEKEVRVLRGRYGFDGDEETLDQIGAELNLSRERIRHIEMKALNKLRHSSNRRVLREVFTDG